MIYSQVNSISKVTMRVKFPDTILGNQIYLQSLWLTSKYNQSRCYHIVVLELVRLDEERLI